MAFFWDKIGEVLYFLYLISKRNNIFDISSSKIKLEKLEVEFFRHEWMKERYLCILIDHSSVCFQGIRADYVDFSLRERGWRGDGAEIL